MTAVQPPPPTVKPPSIIPPPPPPPSSQKNKPPPSSSSPPSNNSNTLEPPPPPTTTTTTTTTMTTNQPKSKTARFHFLQNNPITTTTTSSSSTKTTNPLQRLEDDARRRRSISRHRLQQLEHLLSLWNGQLLTEALERESQHDNLIRTSIHDPLNDVMGNLVTIMEKRRQRRRVGDDLTGDGDAEMDKNEETRLDVLQRRLSHMERLLLRWKCLDADATTQTAFSVTETAVRGDLSTFVAREVIAAGDKENEVTMRFDSIAATLSTELRGEMVERMTDVTFLKRNVGLSSPTTEEDGKREDQAQRPESVDETTMTTRELQQARFLKEISDIRSLLEREREDRKMSDERVLDQIIQTKEYLQKLVLEAIGGGSGVL